MAVRREVIEHYSDDLDGSKADEAVKFALDGKAYVIDLSKKNAAGLRKALQPYVDAARRDTAGRVKTSSKSSTSSSSGVDLAAVRAWAEEQGHAVAARGRVAKDIIDKYLAAH